jgi:hypothetical protein
MIKNYTVLLLASAAIFGGSSAAQADTILVTVSGTLSSGVDTFGTFGTGSANLTGETGQIVFTFDYTPGSANESLTSDTHSYISQHVPSVGFSDVTVNGVTVRSNGLFDSKLTLRNNVSGFDKLFAQTETFNSTTSGIVQLDISSNKVDFITALDFDQSFVVPTNFANFFQTAFFNLEHKNADTGAVELKVSGSISPTSVSFQHIASVPEPASWAMMIGGFALAGAALRRRHTAVRASLA